MLERFLIHFWVDFYPNSRIPSSNNTREDYTWTLPDGQYRNQIAYILCSQWRSSIQSAKTRPGADCGSDHELLIAKFRLKLKKVGKTTRPFRYNLNQIPYDYTVEVTNTFKGLDLINRVLKELWQRFVILDGRWWSKSSPRIRNSKRQNGCLRSPYKELRKEQKWKAKEKRKIYPSECRVPQNSKER